MSINNTSFFLPSPYLTSVNVITFTTINGNISLAAIQQPDPVPDMEYTRICGTKQLRNGDTGQIGRRVFNSRGSDINHRNVTVVCPVVFPSELSYLVAANDSDPGYFSYHDAYNQAYTVVIQENGLIVSNYRNNLTLFQKVTLKLHIVTSV